MKFLTYIYTTLLLIATLFSFWSCDDGDDSRLSEAVLASASSLNFKGNDAPEQIITVYADAEWVSEVPEWITVTPASGSGTMDVTISVTENMRDGSLDNPRKAAIIFKGRTLASQAEVLVLQAGDKYRDVKDYTVSEIASLDNEAVVSVPNITVMAITTAGFIASDDQNSENIYVISDSKVNIGDKVSIMGTKYTDTQSLAYIDSDILETVSTGGTVTYPEATDISDKVDSYNSDSREFIQVTGVLNGSNITIKDANLSISITNAPESFDLKALNGHRVTAKGYFAGVASPVSRIMITELEDKGIAKTIYFSEDFEWLLPWSLAKNAGQTVETDNLSAEAPQLPNAIYDGVSSLDALLNKGYEFLRVTTDKPGECIYLQQNYLKFGKTKYQAGIVLPKIENIPSDATVTLSFDWCPMRQGSGVIDPVNLIVIVTNGDNEVTFDIPESGFAQGERLRWIRAQIELTGVQITKDTKITIRQTQWPAATANRWFLDNIEISRPE